MSQTLKRRLSTPRQTQFLHPAKKDEIPLHSFCAFSYTEDWNVYLSIENALSNAGLDDMTPHYVLN